MFILQYISKLVTLGGGWDWRFPGWLCEGMLGQRYIEIKFSIGARSHTKNLNYRTKILRMVQDLSFGRFCIHFTH